MDLGRQSTMDGRAGDGVGVEQHVDAQMSGINSMNCILDVAIK